MLTLLAIAVAAFIIQHNMALSFRELISAPFKGGDPIRRKSSKILKKIGDLEGLDEEWARKIVLDLKRLRFGSKDSWPNPRAVFKAARRLY